MFLAAYLDIIGRRQKNFSDLDNGMVTDKFGTPVYCIQESQFQPVLASARASVPGPIENG